MMTYRHVVQKGFTLIELLMVVAIIGIISSITVAVLNDAREGARNNARNELARQYVNALGIYFNENGSFPTAGCTGDVPSQCASVTYVCLGTGYPGGSCYVWGSHSENATANTQISDYIPTPASTETAISGGVTFSGMAYGCVDDDTCKAYKLSWILEGDGADAQCFGGAVATVLNPEIKICTFQS